jgi:hypothetical protein
MQEKSMKIKQMFPVSGQEKSEASFGIIIVFTQALCIYKNVIFSNCIFSSCND